MLDNKIAYLANIKNKIENSKNVDSKYKLKIRLEYLANKIKSYELKIENLKNEQSMVDENLNNLINEQNNGLKNDKKKFKCPCGSVVLLCKKKKHYTSMKHCLFLDKNPNIVIDEQNPDIIIE